MTQKIIEKASFDKAYRFYRNKNDKAAIGVIRKLDQNEPRVMELKAQIAYRMENFEEAMNLLKKLLRTHSDEFDEIRRSNFIAVQARLHSQGFSSRS
ncbi:SRP72 domain-containing protein [Meloidogyne graminicola]|uniref:SRP72 domain-containing protein n=1 Tax=Meloidogyne graminicola TaxID=189291 RepID=A0A8S9ZXD4_9BILA|nr:SRP72 domain-containing protein [Meloidogyne graminicola]